MTFNGAAMTPPSNALELSRFVINGVVMDRIVTRCPCCTQQMTGSVEWRRGDGRWIESLGSMERFFMQTEPDILKVFSDCTRCGYHRQDNIPAPKVTVLNLPESDDQMLARLLASSNGQRVIFV